MARNPTRARPSRRGAAARPAHGVAADWSIAASTRVAATPGSVLFMEGDELKSWYRLVSGAVRVSKLLSDGRRQICDFCFAGDFVGVGFGAVHSSTAEVLKDAVLLRYPIGAIERTLRERPERTRPILDLALERLAGAQNHMLLLGRRDATERLAAFILTLGKDANPGAEVDLAMSRADIGDYLGLALETVSRSFSHIRELGLIDLPGPHSLRIIDRRALARVAAGDY
jgi:CRP-like cAMP-binding protein